MQLDCTLSSEDMGAYAYNGMKEMSEHPVFQESDPKLGNCSFSCWPVYTLQQRTALKFHDISGS